MGIAREEEIVWVCANGLDLDKARVTTLDTSALVMQAVRAGHGVSIVPRAIAAAGIARGNLQVLCEEEDSAFAYHILTLPTRVSPKLAPFMRWLKAQVCRLPAPDAKAKADVMRIIRDYTFVEPEDRGASVAIGNFDGVHLGHQ